jgi:hypothetical protein
VPIQPGRLSITDEINARHVDVPMLMIVIVMIHPNGIVQGSPTIIQDQPLYIEMRQKKKHSLVSQEVRKSER